MNVKVSAVEELPRIMKNKELIKSKYGMITHKEYGKSAYRGIILSCILLEMFFLESVVTFMEVYKKINISDYLLNSARMIPIKIADSKNCTYEDSVLRYE